VSVDAGAMTIPVNRLIVVVKVLAALLGFSAIVTEIATLVSVRHFVAANFFSFFTVESNALAVVSLLLSSFVAVAGGISARLEFFRGAVTLFMTTTILIFIVLLSRLPASELTAVPWDNTVLHYIMPLVIIIDWLVVNRRQPIEFRRALLWLAFPLLYLSYSLIRGPIVGWYPYPFMDASVHGYSRVILTSLIIAVVLTGLTAVLSRAPAWMPGRYAVAR
jgi:hypothetical protein